MTDAAFWPVLIALAVLGLLLDAIPDKPGKWGSGDASAADVAKIVAGGKPPATPRMGAKFGVVLLFVAVLWFMFFGG